MNQFKKESLGLFPTPMYRLPNISRELGTNIWIKRDDLCGVALGGNKVRKLEYLLHDAKSKGYDLVMTTGQAQSNHAMLTAACALRMGLDCILLTYEGDPILWAVLETYDICRDRLWTAHRLLALAL